MTEQMSIQSNNQKIVKAGIICITDDEALIVVNRGDGKNPKIGFPKGHINLDGENMMECAARETYEETGIEFSPQMTGSVFDINDTRYYVVNTPIDVKNIDPKDNVEILMAKRMPLYSLLNFTNTKFINNSMRKYLETYCNPCNTNVDIW